MSKCHYSECDEPPSAKVKWYSEEESRPYCSEHADQATDEFPILAEMVGRV